MSREISVIEFADKSAPTEINNHEPDGVVKTSIYSVVCPVATLNILHVWLRPATEHYSSESPLRSAYLYICVFT